ncbi:OLC1v1025536C3 [Oldenlandia corymbosa var. corymbosa]|uniref:OLC1v1025536C3 n=1 Tax=Oldenlandia corymbosa var. corymbosa TaxID=529605 RepID=A0AAV1C552_OLDCO|nr:OLC1v1025536C3 [Oldenlandia corymbosa var. corymbosa]
MRNVVLRLISSFDTALTALWVFDFSFSFSLTTIDWFLLFFISLFQFFLPHKSNGVFSSPEFVKFLETLGSLRFPIGVGSLGETMASSQVEIASNSSPFGYVLKDRNRYRTRDSSNAFQKNFKDLVHSHLNSCISGHSRNSGSGNNFIDYTDLWVYSPQNNDENDFHSQNSGSNFMSGNSDSNENSQPDMDYTDLWVHNPQRNNNENVMKKTKAGEKWDKARNLASERKIQESSSRNIRKHDDASSGPVLPSKRGKRQDHLSSGPVSASSPRGRLQENASAEAVLASNIERSPENGSAAGPVSTSQRGRNWEVVSSRLFPIFQRRKSQEGTVSGPDSRSQRENSPEISVEVPSSRGVSSLVQKWKDIEAEGKSLSATNSPVCTSRSNSVQFFTDNESVTEAVSRSSDACEEFFDLRPATPAKSEDLFLDWESDQTGFSGPPSVRSRDSDATEKDKTRVADIIKKLSSNGENHNDLNHQSLPRVRTSVDKPDLRTFSPVACTPRIRGRQAFADVLMHMERDRLRELEGLADSKAVSRFSHKGRIQAMLRLRFLRHGGGGKDARHTISMPSGSSRFAQSAISHLRQRFDEGVHLNDTDSRSQQGEEFVEKVQQEKKFSATNQQIEENHHKELTAQTKSLNVSDDNLDAQIVIRTNAVVDFNHQDPNTVVQQNDCQQEGSEILHQEDDSTSDFTQQEMNSECRNNKRHGFTLEEPSVKNNLGSECSEIEECKNKQLTGNSDEYMDAIDEEAQGDYLEEAQSQQNLESHCSQEAYGSHPCNEWEEIEDYYEPQEESNQDWIWDVSRPRSTWEDLRQARYQEMLDPFTENDDIRELLKRKSVSSFLSSGLKDSIDRLMMSRVQQPQSPTVSRVKRDEGTDYVVEREEAQNVEVEEEQQKEFDEGQLENEEKIQSKTDECEKDKEEEIQSEKECNASNDDARQATSSDDNEEDYFGSPSFPPSQESHTFNSSSPETQPSSSFTNHPSIEMQFMYEMRGNMEQLHQEISELRRSLKSCISMQMKLQKSMTQDASNSPRHSGRL